MTTILVRESMYTNSLNYEGQLYESLLNEGFNIEDAKKLVSKITDKKELIINLIKKFNKTQNLSVKKYIVGAITVAYLIGFASKNNKWKDRPDELARMASTELADASHLSPEDVIAYLEASDTHYGKQQPRTTDSNIEQETIYQVTDNSETNYRSAKDFKISEDGIKFIKRHERLKRKAYDIKDGKITIGYGHAESKKISKYKVGDRITKPQAEELLLNDLKKAERGVKRIFGQWERNDNEVKITQSMYDALISMAFNMGVSGLRSTEFIQLLKAGHHQEAANVIKYTKLRKGFRGLDKRRAAEAELFVNEM